MAIVRDRCSGCSEDFVLNTVAMTVTMTRPSNGVRGKNHRPAEKVTAEVVEAASTLLEWDCPLCDYAESQEEE